MNCGMPFHSLTVKVGLGRRRGCGRGSVLVFVAADADAVAPVPADAAEAVHAEQAVETVEKAEQFGEDTEPPLASLARTL